MRLAQLSKTDPANATCLATIGLAFFNVRIDGALGCAQGLVVKRMRVLSLIQTQQTRRYQEISIPLALYVEGLWRLHRRQFWFRLFGCGLSGEALV